MSWLTQTDRFLQLTSPLAKDVLLLTEFVGAEKVSASFQFNLQLRSANTQIDPQSIINKPMIVQLSINPMSTPRYFHGYVEQFEIGALEQGIRHYSAQLRPWLWFLNFTSDCRIFQNKSVIDIAESIFKQFGFRHYDTSGLSKNYAKRDYCVQYQETALHFVQRLLQEAGIFYYYQHTANKHTLMLTDLLSHFKACTDSPVSYSSGTSTTSGIKRWWKNYQFYPGKVTLADYNYLTPDNALQSTQASTAKLASAQKYELFHYSNSFETNSEGRALSQQYFDAHESQYGNIEGESNCSSFTCGSKFSLTLAPVAADDGDYVLMSVEHYASDGSYSQGSQSYYNHFACLAINTAYAPTPSRSKPRIYGVQSATVVGPAGQELYTDKYGAVKVQFHWDRIGGKDDHSSCWIRVAQSWASKGWGMQFLPRIGQEVLVLFLEGDPDQPVVVGSVYNADNLPSYELPFDQHISGIKTHSTQGGGATECNELRFNDKLGKEELYLGAQKDFNRCINNNETAIIVQGNHNMQVQAGSSSVEAAQSIEFKVGENSLLINAAGIYINGTVVNINS